MLDNDNAISASISEALEKTPTNEKDYHMEDIVIRMASLPKIDLQFEVFQ